MWLLTSSRKDTRLHSQQAKLCAQEPQVGSHSCDNTVVLSSSIEGLGIGTVHGPHFVEFSIITSFTTPPSPVLVWLNSL